MAQRAPSICAYCGVRDPQSVDHVPPRGLFPRPWPDDLITVPCCTTCHVRWSKDDEHFRNVLVSAEELECDPRAARVRDSVARSLGRPEHERYATGFVKSMADVDVFTEGGIWTGRQPGIPLTPRIGEVVARIAKGLFFREFGTPFPRTHEVLKPHLDQRGRSLRRIADLGIRAPQMRVACGGQFAYAFAMTHDAPTSGIWMGEFLGKVWAMAFLRERRGDGRGK